MKQSIRNPLFLALALTFAAPLAFAQSTTPQTTDPQSQPQQTQPTEESTQSTTTQSTTQSDTSATTQTDPAATAATPATPATPASPATPQKKNWSDLDLDKNGTLSATEAASVNSLSKAFTTADANADGELTQDEYKAYLNTNEQSRRTPGSSN